MADNHYDTLEISPTASQAEIKQAYRRLAKRFHPDSNREIGNHERISRINLAYEVLGDPGQRRSYDHQIYATSSSRSGSAESSVGYSERQQRDSAAQRQHRQRPTGRDHDEHFQQWQKQVYQPVNRMLNQILRPLRDQIDDLAADPFDDQLLEGFQSYLDECRTYHQQAQRAFRSMPNPANVASVAAHLYYCLNQVQDGIDELERFVSCYDEHYLHTGQELFRIASGLRREAQAAMRSIK